VRSEDEGLDLTRSKIDALLAKRRRRRALVTAAAAAVVLGVGSAAALSGRDDDSRSVVAASSTTTSSPSVIAACAPEDIAFRLVPAPPTGDGVAFEAVARNDSGHVCASPSSFAVDIVDESGAAVLNRAMSSGSTTEDRWEPGEQLSVTESWDATIDGSPAPSGRYTMTCTWESLGGDGGAERYVSSATFDIE
jgi:hypothetical protein